MTRRVGFAVKASDSGAGEGQHSAHAPALRREVTAAYRRPNTAPCVWPSSALPISPSAPWPRWSAAATRWRPSTPTPPPRPRPGAGPAAFPGAGLRRRDGTGGAHAGLHEGCGRHRSVPRPGAGGGRGGRLWPDPGARGAGGAAARLLQPARLAAAAVAGRGPHPAGDHGRRRRHRRAGDADGRGAGRGPRAAGPPPCRSASGRHGRDPAGEAGGGRRGPAARAGARRPSWPALR